MPKRTVTVGGAEYRLKDHIPMADFTAWFQCNQLDEAESLAGLNAVLATPLSAEEAAALDVAVLWGLHAAIQDFFLLLRSEQSAPPAS